MSGKSGTGSGIPDEVSSSSERQTSRESARDAFWALYGAGFLLGFLLRIVDAPDVVGLPLVFVWAAAVLSAGGLWLARGVRDGALARALPDYLYAMLALLVIAVGCAVTAALALVIVGAQVTLERACAWAAVGTVVVLVIYWVTRKEPT